MINKTFSGIDFKINMNDSDIKLLQLTDIQIIDSSQARSKTRLRPEEQVIWRPENIYINAYNYIQEAIERTSPDIIFITGDFIYGEFDDNGTTLINFITFMDSFQIPWAPVFGNHDNESLKGVTWQCLQLTQAKYSLFKRGDTIGNSNYIIGLEYNSKISQLMYMLDSNGCGNCKDPFVQKHGGLTEEQKQWLKQRSDTIFYSLGYKVPGIACFHIPSKDFEDASLNAGYQTNRDKVGNYQTYDLSTLNITNGDYGIKDECVPIEKGPEYVDLFQEIGISGVFVGHCHKMNTSIMYKGIRWTYGTKTGIYDYHNKYQIGATVITMNLHDQSFTISPFLSKI